MSESILQTPESRDFKGSPEPPPPRVRQKNKENPEISVKIPLGEAFLLTVGVFLLAVELVAYSSLMCLLHALPTVGKKAQL